MEQDLVRKSINNYECKICDYKSVRRSQYDRHLMTAKHMKLYMEQNGAEKGSTALYECVCGNSYKYRRGLNKHQLSCKYADMSNTPSETSTTMQSSIMPIDTSVVIELLRQNNEFKELMVEQYKQNAGLQEQLLEAVKDGKIGNTIHNNNTTNNTTNNKFNLNFFLNETCKDAITMSDFINSIDVTMEDFIRTGNIGFVEGISKVMVERIKDMEMHTRPMHCTDLKRETVYIKDEEKWEKDDADKTSLRRAVKNVANKNYKQLQKWYDNSKPNVEQIGSEDCENYFKYYKASLGGYDKEEDKKFEEKIIKNVLKEVVLDKMPPA